MHSQPDNDTTISGQRCIIHTSSHVWVATALDVGPRILGFGLAGSPNMFAATDLVLDTDAGGCALYGGHRLWAGPEVPARTYTAENDSVMISTDPTGLSVSVAGQVRSDLLRRTISFVIDADSPTVTVTHQLENLADTAVALAPWALTMLAPGGTVIVPVPQAPTDDHSVQASSSSLVLWPYTDLGDRCLTLRAGAVVIDTAFTPADTSFKNKIGVKTSARWCSYVRDGVVFTKSAEPTATSVDAGANRQVFWENRFVELETLAPLSVLPPDATVEHVETWELNRVAPGAEGIDSVISTHTG